MTITVPKSGIIDIKLFDKMLDISKVAWYSFKEQKDGSLHLKFYDSKRKVIKPYAGPNEEKTTKNKSKKVKNK